MIIYASLEHLNVYSVVSVVFRLLVDQLSLPHVYSKKVKASYFHYVVIWFHGCSSCLILFMNVGTFPLLIIAKLLLTKNSTITPFVDVSSVADGTVSVNITLYNLLLLPLSAVIQKKLHSFWRYGFTVSMKVDQCDYHLSSTSYRWDLYYHCNQINPINI